jgi:hypothetical protein
MYRWIVFLHVTSAFVFLLTHGASAVVSFRLRDERDLQRIRALLELSSYPWNAMFGTLLLMLISGVVTGFMGHWWGKGWIWVSLGLLLAVSAVSWSIGTRHFNQLREATGLPWFDGRREHAASPPLSPEAVVELISAGRPWLLMGIGVGGIVVITWLMMFKPF